MMTRIGQPPKRLILLRLAAEVGAFRVPVIAPASAGLAVPDGRKKGGPRIEFLGAGTQFVGDGVHPETKLPYYWTGGDPADVPIDRWPVIQDEAEARALVALLVDVLVQDFGYSDREPAAVELALNGAVPAIGPVMPVGAVAAAAAVPAAPPLTDTRTKRLTESVRMLNGMRPMEEVVDHLMSTTPVAEGQPINWNEVRQECKAICFEWIS
jgi:hypothetical protein